MKKVVLFALVAFGLTSQISAQSFSVAHDTVTAYTAGSVDVHNTVNNLTSGNLAINWKVVDSSIAPGWTIDGICDNQLCYPWGTVQPGALQTSGDIEASKSMDFKVQYSTTGAAIGSMTSVTIRFSESLNSKTATFIATKVPTGVTSVTRIEDDVVLYPNPAKDDLNVVFSNTTVRNIAVYNLIGKIVSIYKVNGNSAKLNVSNIPSGIYFVRLLDGQGRIVATRKFTH